MLKKMSLFTLLLICVFNFRSSGGTYIVNNSFSVAYDEIGYIDFYADPDYDYSVDIDITSGGRVDIFLLDNYDFADYTSDTVESFSYYTVGTAVMRDLCRLNQTYTFD